MAFKYVSMVICSVKYMSLNRFALISRISIFLISRPRRKFQWVLLYNSEECYCLLPSTLIHQASPTNNLESRWLIRVWCVQLPLTNVGWDWFRNCSWFVWYHDVICKHTWFVAEHWWGISTFHLDRELRQLLLLVGMLRASEHLISERGGEKRLRVNVFLKCDRWLVAGVTG